MELYFPWVHTLGTQTPNANLGRSPSIVHAVCTQVYSWHALSKVRRILAVMEHSETTMGLPEIPGKHTIPPSTSASRRWKWGSQVPPDTRRARGMAWGSDVRVVRAHFARAMAIASYRRRTHVLLLRKRLGRASLKLHRVECNLARTTRARPRRPMALLTRTTRARTPNERRHVTSLLLPKREPWSRMS